MRVALTGGPVLGTGVDTDSATGRLVTSAVIAGIAVLLAGVGGCFVARPGGDPLARYQGRKIVRSVMAALALLMLALIWRPFAGRIGVVLGLTTAGLAFAMQEVIGALAGGLNILSGGIFRVGDRIQMGGVRGDVIDITPLRTKILEIGSSPAASRRS